MIKSRGRWYWKLGLGSLLVLGGVIYSFDNFAVAQLIPDTTLNSEGSVIKRLNSSVNQIDGGAIRGKNSFHSFQEFNVGKGQEVYFTNPSGIVNILSRVTGSNPSNILGKLGVLGNANLFLLNPNGIIFGLNSSLDVKGSFTVTTANAIQFGHQGFFSASAPNVPSVLTVNPSALLFKQIAAASITNNSIEPVGQLNENLSESSPIPLFGLKVPDGYSLLLVGGNVNLNGGGLNANGGQIELGGLAGIGTVGLNVNGNSLHLSFPNSVVLADISLSNQARVDASGDGGGSIQVQGRRITVASGSQITTNTLGSSPGGTLVLTGSDSVNLIGYTKGGVLSTSSLGSGNAANLTINTSRLLVQDGAQILTSAFANGLGGDLIVNALESSEVIGTGSITSPRFITYVPSGLFSSTNAAGNAGNLTINTGRLFVQNGGMVSAASSGVNAQGSEQIIPAMGQGGNVWVNASNSVQLSGTSPDGMLASSLSTSTMGGGAAGNIKINTGQLIVLNGAVVDVGSGGTGTAGNLEVRAPSIHLDNEAVLSAETKAGQGGINLAARELILRGGSKITTSGSVSGAGGNINIKTGVLTVLEDSNISATSQESFGGRVMINAQGIFRSRESDITASSALGPKFSGTVQINTLVNNPSLGLVNLPVKPVNVTGLIAQGCPADVGPRASIFVVTGRGGLPPTPREALRSEPTLVDLGTTVPGQENHASATDPSKTTSSEPAPLVEATGWVTNALGEVVLVAQAPTVTPDIPWLTPTTCHAP